MGAQGQLELRTRADDVERSWISADTQAKMAAAQARTKEMEAGRAPWYRPGLRDRRLAEAAELHARSQHAQTAAADLERQRTELHDQIPGGQHWLGHTARARSQVQRAEATYGPDLEVARLRDQATLAELRGQISMRGRNADTTSARRDELTAEHQLRAEMPPEQAATENYLRDRWQLEQQIAENHRAIEQQQRAIAASRDYHYDHSRDHGQDHGFGLGF